MLQQEKRDRLQVWRQIKRNFSHPSHIEIIDMFGKRTGELCIVTEWVEGQTLRNYLSGLQDQIFVSEEQILSWFTQICLGLKHLHDKQCAYGALDARNIFVNQFAEIKIKPRSPKADVGQCTLNFGYDQLPLQAPELLKRPISKSPLTQLSLRKADVWFLGTVLYELVAKKRPFASNNLVTQARSIVQGKVQPMDAPCSEGLANLVASCMSTDPDQRPTIDEVLASPLLQEQAEY